MQVRRDIALSFLELTHLFINTVFTWLHRIREWRYQHSLGNHRTAENIDTLH